MLKKEKTRRKRNTTTQQKSTLSSLIFICTQDHRISTSNHLHHSPIASWTFTDLFKNICVRSGYNSPNRMIRMDVEPKSDVSISENATANAHFQSSHSVDFFYLDHHTHMELRTPKWLEGNHVSLHFQLVIMWKNNLVAALKSQQKKSKSMSCNLQ